MVRRRRRRSEGTVCVTGRHTDCGCNSGKIKDLLPHIQKWFLQKEEYFAVFSAADSRIEGWFKAELLVLLNRLVMQGHLDGFEREVNITSPKDSKRKQVDFQLRLQGENHLCELKAVCISQAVGTPRNLHFYFRDDDLGLMKDFKKLDELTRRNKWMLAFVYPTPNSRDWDETTLSLPSAVKHWRSVTRPQDFPEFVFISLWEG